MEPKWQRISFMPATPLGEDGRRVTGSAAHIALSRRAAAEGMVLLKNENETLPLKRGSRAAGFGKAQADYVKGGGGSGDTTVAYVRSLAQGLRMKQDEGKIEIFEPLERFYAEDVQAQYAAGATPGKTREPILDDALVQQARAFTDTAVITICRFSGEDYDRTGQPHDGDAACARGRCDGRNGRMLHLLPSLCADEYSIFYHEPPKKEICCAKKRHTAGESGSVPLLHFILGSSRQGDSALPLPDTSVFRPI